ncbi:aminotransferase class III-fold pyridoxal phosphate-dependent enzyme [Thauera sp. SDU_THAU2]|uniref:aminotransferase class III-fold pyridoxal phosphate-dependent enzyme n=1 Tax=Thauera sp. SDU_THAU2 TaxID=3136633 RepID=UPI004054FB0A
MRRLCDEYGLLLILDEVQSGVGRTGRLFAHEWAGVTPDIMAVAKGIGGGFPLGACLATAEAASGMAAGTHGSTYGGNPLAMAVGNAVLDVVLADDFLEHVRDVALVFPPGARRAQGPFPGGHRGHSRRGSAAGHQGEDPGWRAAQGGARRKAARGAGRRQRPAAPAAP